MIYFDNSATTKPYPEALETYMQVSTKIIGNPSSLHRLGDQSTRILEASRQQIADLIGKKAKKSSLHLVGLKGITGLSKVLHLKKRNLVNTLLCQLLSTQQSRSQLFGSRLKVLKWILHQLMKKDL